MICKALIKTLFFCLLPLFALAEEMTLSSQEMQELIRDFRIDIQQSPSIMHAPLANDYIQHLGQKISSYAQDTNVHYAFFINDTSEINAFAGPGGTIVIYTGLILGTDKEDELAAVLAHEIAHSEQKHWLKDLNRREKMKIPFLASTLASLALGAINPALGGSALMGSISGYAQNEINHTRSHEEEADRIGIQLLYAAGYNPQGMVDFLKQLQKYDQYHDMSGVPAILLTHPLDEVRIADAENRVAQLPKKQYTNSYDFFLFKEIIRVLTASTPSSLVVYYQKMLEKNPSNSALHYGYALSLMKTMKWNQAEAELKPLIKKSPYSYYYLLALGGCELGLKHIQQGLNILQSLYNNYPDNLAIILDYATALTQFNQYKKAEAVLYEGLKDYPNNLVLMKSLAQTLARDHQAARAYLIRANVFMQLGQLREAGIALQSAKKSVNNDPLLLAQINAKIGEVRRLERQQL